MFVKGNVSFQTFSTKWVADISRYFSMHKTSYKTLDTKRTRFQEQEKILPILLSRIRNTKLPLFREVVLDLIELFIQLYKGNNPNLSIFLFSLINVKMYIFR